MSDKCIFDIVFWWVVGGRTLSLSWGGEVGGNVPIYIQIFEGLIVFNLDHLCS